MQLHVHDFLQDEREQVVKMTNARKLILFMFKYMKKGSKRAFM